MTKEDLLNHREVIINKLTQAKADYHAYEGALQECDYWLAKFENEVKEED